LGEAEAKRNNCGGGREGCTPNKVIPLRMIEEGGGRRKVFKIKRD
jgi:hypothetical protein